MRVVVHVEPGARREIFTRVKTGEFHAAVREKAERNAANARVQQLVAHFYGVEKSAVRFVTGARGSRKTFEVIR